MNIKICKKCKLYDKKNFIPSRGVELDGNYCIRCLERIDEISFLSFCTGKIDKKDWNNKDSFKKVFKKSKVTKDCLLYVEQLMDELK